MGKFRKRPVEIEARRWDGSAQSGEEIVAWVKAGGGHALYWAPGAWTDEAPECAYVEVHTLEGNMLANAGDYVIRGVAGEFYPCKPDIFEATYEPVEGDDA